VLLPELRPKITEKESLILSVPAGPLPAVVYSSRIERGEDTNPNNSIRLSLTL
jgi:hypothetical protein